MYDLSMNSITFPLAVPEDLYGEIRRTAKETDLSMADVIRQSVRIGIPKLRSDLGSQRVTNVSPLPDKVARQLYKQREDDTVSIRKFIEAQPKDAQ